MLDERKTAILKTVVTEYIETAQPVGSAHVVGEPGIDVSPATVRSEMAALEREGYLSHPHTSAGRIPTDKGYRFFVDEFCGQGRLGEAEERQVRDFFSSAHGELERMLRSTSNLLSELTNCAAVVIAPDHEALRIRSLVLVRLAPRLALLVVVLSNGSIEKHTLDLEEDDPDLAIEAAAAKLALHATGALLAEVEPCPPSGDPKVDRILAAALAGLRDITAADQDQVFVGGASRMASAFDAVDTVRAVLSMLEKSYLVVSLLSDALTAGRNVSIGGEHGIGPLAECSVVVAPYLADDEVVGTVGVLGPTRMNYPQALAAVALVGQRLSRQLTGEGR